MKLRSRALLMNEHGHILFVKLKNSPDFWCLPGGKAEKNESMLECIKRELLEELGVEVPLRLLLIEEIPHIESLEFIFTGTILSSALQEKASHSFELSAIKFFDPCSCEEELYPSYLKTPGNLQVLLAKIPPTYLLTKPL